MSLLPFASDYQEGAHPAILDRLCQTNLLASPGYGTDEFCESARNRIRAACECPKAAVHFLVGGTQANATVIDALLGLCQGVIAADTGHIATHEAGAIEASGHKVLTLPHRLGKLDAQQVRAYCRAFWSDDNHEHMVMPGMVYISQPTEYGTIYSLQELTALSEVCHEFDMPLYVDGARLAYALACEQNDVTLPDLARLTDAFYLGGTKCGTLFGEAVVLPNPSLIPHFFTIIKQHGALLAKGRILGVQFDTLFEDGLYGRLGTTAVTLAQRIRRALIETGHQLAFDAPTNQVFPVFANDELNRLAQAVSYSYWERADEDHTVIRLATSWATTAEQVDELAAVLNAL